MCNGSLLGRIDKKWLSWGDSYCLTVQDDSNAAFFVAIVIAIDNCIHNGQQLTGGGLSTIKVFKIYVYVRKGAKRYAL